MISQVYSNFGSHQIVFDFILHKKTGILIFQPVGRKLFFEEGSLVFASSERPSEHFSEVLTKMGVLDHQKLDEVKASLRKGESLGRKLKEEGLASSQQLIQALKQQITHIIDMIFTEESGECLVQEGSLPNKVPTLKIKIMALLIRTITNLKSKDYLNTIPIDNPIQKTEAFESVCENVELPAQFEEFLEHIKTNEVIYAEELCQDFHWDRRYTDDLFYILNLLGATDYQPQPEPEATEEDAQEDGEFTFSSISPDDFNEEPLHVIDDEEPLSDTAPSLGENQDHENPLEIDLESLSPEAPSYNEVTVQADPDRPLDDEFSAMYGAEPEDDENSGPGLDSNFLLNSEDEEESLDDRDEPSQEADELSLPQEEDDDSLEDYSATTRKVLLEEDLKNYKGPLDIQFPEEKEELQETTTTDSHETVEEGGFSPNETQPVEVYSGYDEPISGSSRSRRYLLFLIPSIIIAAGLFAMYQMGMLDGEPPAPEPVQNPVQTEQPTLPPADSDIPDETAESNPNKTDEADSLSQANPPSGEPQPASVDSQSVDPEPAPVQPPPTDGSKDLEGILEQSINNFRNGQGPYSIAVLLACERQTITKLLVDLDTQNVFITPRRYNGRDCYTLSWGSFSSYQEATGQLSSLPEALRKAGDPWVKDIAKGL